MDKVAVVTGASSGIGREIAIRLAQNGYRVAINYLHNARNAHETLERLNNFGGRHFCEKCDMRNPGEIKEMLARVGRELGTPSLVVNNAGVTKYLPFLEATEALWEEITFTDWKGPFFCTQTAAKAMIAANIQGLVVNITSIHQETCFPISNIYGPTKAALDKFTRHAALELAPYGIRVVSIAPGCIQIREGEAEGGRGRMLTSRIPMGRYGTTGEIADAVLWLAKGEGAQYITGSCIDINGGALLPSHLDNMYTTAVPANGSSAGHNSAGAGK